MTRKEFADLVAAEYGTSRAAAEEWVTAICHTLCKAVLENDVVKLHGFGYIEKKVRAPKVGRLPNGERIDIPARVKLNFVPSAYLDNAVKEEMSFEEFEEYMDKYRAIRRGEEVPGYIVSGDKLLKLRDDYKPKMAPRKK